MTWLDHLRNWDYSLGGITTWILNLMEFHIQRTGWPAYVGIAVFFIGLGLAFPATRGVTSLIVSGTFRMIFAYIQIVLSLVTVQLVGFLGKVLLAQFHRTRRWIVELAGKARGN